MTPKLLLLLIYFTRALSASESNPPKANCDFDGARPDSALRRVASSGAAYYFACNRPGHAGCLKSILQPGAMLSVDREENGWSCVSGADSTSGWVESARLENLPETPKPALEAWVGWWRRGKSVKGVKGDVLLLTRGDAPGSIRVSGKAYWYGLESEHFGEVGGEAVPIGNNLRIVEGQGGGCVVYLRLSQDPAPALHTPTLHTEDNEKCGGMNVRFSGNWERFQPVANNSSR